MQLSTIRFVKGRSEALPALALPNLPNGETLLMDEDEPIFYVRSADGKKLTAYRFEEIEPPAPAGYVKQEQYDELRSKYESLVSRQAESGAGTES